MRLVESTSIMTLAVEDVADDVRDFQQSMGLSEASDDEITETITDLRRLVKGGRLPVYRALSGIADAADIEIEGHRHWAYDIRYAVPYGGGSSNYVVISASVAERDVDWLSTLAVIGTDEREIRPNGGASLPVVKIEKASGQKMPFPKGLTLRA